MFRPRTHGMLILAALIAVASGCSRGPAEKDEAPEIGMDLRVSSTEVGGKALLAFSLTDAQGEPVQGAELTVTGQAETEGAEPVVRQAYEQRGGVYLVPFTWTEGGNWALNITAVLPDGRTLRRSFKVRVLSLEEVP